MRDVPAFTHQTFGARCQALAPFGVFTTARSAEEEFDDLAVIAQHAQEARRAVGAASKVRVGRYVAETQPCPVQIAQLFETTANYLGQQGVKIGEINGGAVASATVVGERLVNFTNGEAD